MSSRIQEEDNGEERPWTQEGHLYRGANNIKRVAGKVLQQVSTTLNEH
jgi:hypothetical protein